MASSIYRDNDEVKEQLRRSGAPMKLTNFMVDHPCKCMCCGYLVLIVLTVIFFMGEMYKVSMDGRRDYLAEYDPIVIDWDMIGLASKVV